MLNNRYEFVLLFDVNKGNPNGDPDSANQPRTDFETGKGLVTDVSIKRKIRNYVSTQKQDQPPFEIYVKERGILADQQKRAYLDLGIKASDGDENVVKQARDWMCKNFFDIRAFGAVMTTGKAIPTKGNDKEKLKQRQEEELKKLVEKGVVDGKATVKDIADFKWNCGQVRGPVQLGFAESVDPVEPMNITITRVALTNADDTKRGTELAEEGGDTETASSSQFGNKYIIPYGLYKLHGFISPSLCKNTGFSKDDLKLLFEALEKMFDFDRSASRGEMTTRKLIIFEHASELTGSESEEEKQKKINEQKLGFAAAHKLFEKIKIAKKAAIEAPREFGHYDIWFGKEDEEGKAIIEKEDINQELKSAKTVITISVKGENKDDWSLAENPQWMS